VGLWKSNPRRDLAFWACLTAGASCLLAGVLLFVAARSLFDAEVFGERAARSLSDPGVAAYAAEMVTRSVIKSRPDLIAVRPLLLASANSIVSARPFGALVGAAATRAHEAAFSEGGRRVILSVPDLEVLVRDALRQASPELAAKIPKQLEAAIGSLGDGHRARYLVDAWRIGQNLKWLWRALFPLGVALLSLALWLARARRRGLVRLGMALVVTGLILAALPAASGMAAMMIDSPLERGLVQGLVRAFFGDLEDWGLFLVGLGVLFAAGASSLLEHVDPITSLQRFGRLTVAPPPSIAGRLGWGLALLTLGLLSAGYPAEMLRAATIVMGVCAAYIGVRELFRLFLERLAPAALEVDTLHGRQWALAVSVVMAVVAVLGVAWALWRNPAVKKVHATEMACNGYPTLCDKRVDEVVFAGAHNAMSNQEIDGWMFPHHEGSIPHQLRDGVRALLIDVHYGFPGAARIKTDMSGEPLADKVKEAIGAEAYEAALRIRNRLVGADEGHKGVYLCHGLCELGAYELEPTLADIHEFLVAHPDEVLLLDIEDYVKPEDIAAAFETSGLSEFVYKGPVSPRLPTLREMIGAGQRVLVVLESGRPGVEWLRPAYQGIVRETPYSFHKPEDFSCRPNRGVDGSPLFLLNHWIETTPMPKPSNAAIVNSYEVLLARARQCAQERGHLPNIVAVDFYKTGDLVRVVDQLNGTAAAQPAAR
jgi:hypothetical protein